MPPSRPSTGLSARHQPATMDGLWIAAITGHYTTARLHAPAAAAARQLMPDTH
jgi:hypothetical protein